MTDLQSWEEDKTLYLFTSLTAGSSHVITATSRIETILKNARIPFSYIDTATNESARKLFQRRGKGKKLPLLVKEGFIIGDLEQVEDWNEFGELKEAIGTVATTSTSVTTTPAKQPATGASSAAGTPSKAPASESAAATAGAQDASTASPAALALRKAAFESASAAKERQAAGTSAATPPTVSITRANTPATPKGSSSTSQAAPPPSPSTIPLPMSPLSPTSPAAAGGASSSLSRHGSSASSASGHGGMQYVPSSRMQPPATTHRGSSVSLASEEEIREIESKETIMEESEEEEDEVSRTSGTGEKKLAEKVASPVAAGTKTESQKDATSGSEEKAG